MAVITTVIPIYNCEAFVADTIESVIGQNIGFVKNIKIVLVDDGSTDNSEKICRQYQQQFPQNILIVSQPNAGVSAARNNGLSHVNSEYVHFLDSDDIIDGDFYAKAIDFMQKHNGVDFAAAKIKLFDASIDEHPLSYKFATTRVIDVTNEPDNPIMHVSSCVFRRSALEGRRFDDQLRIAEDAKFVADVLLQKKAYGVLSDTTFHYRKRADSSSAINGQYSNRTFYTETPRRFLMHLLDAWQTDDGSVAAYAQCVVLYDLRWRLRQAEQTTLNAQEEDTYKQDIYSLIRRLDDEVIAAKRGLPLHYKTYMLSVKHGGNWAHVTQYRNGAYFVGSTQLGRVAGDTVHVQFMRRRNDDWILEGYTERGPLIPGDMLELSYDGMAIQPRMVSRPQRETYFLGDRIFDGAAFEVCIPYSHSTHARGVISFGYRTGKVLHQIPIQTERFSGMSTLPYSYRRKHGMLTRKEHGVIAIYRATFARQLYFEMTYLLVISLNWRLRTMRTRLKRLQRYNLALLSSKRRAIELVKPFLFTFEAVACIPRAWLLRSMYYAVRPLVRTPIWILSDRGMMAGDSGEALFRYIQRQQNVPARVYFAISRKSPDYRRMKAIGRTVNSSGLYYKLLFLLSDKVISSQADVETTNPFIRQIDHYVDLFSFDYVFLQHGVIRYDLSSWLNRFEKNIKLFITTGQKEHDSILALPYFYHPENVLLSGLPRYDLLDSQPSGKIILAPTYRKNLATMKTDKNGARKYDASFRATDYYRFYTEFMSDERLIAAMQKYNMTGELYVHPAFGAQVCDFERDNGIFKVKGPGSSYREAFHNGNLLISDFSSVVFDFAYLKKPVVYSQFDKKTFFEGHTYNNASFFVDEQDGFGPVANTHDELVDHVVELIERGCGMEAKYQSRVDDFFAWRDKHNSQRVYDAVCTLGASE